MHFDIVDVFLRVGYPVLVRPHKHEFVHFELSHQLALLDFFIDELSSEAEVSIFIIEQVRQLLDLLEVLPEQILRGHLSLLRANPQLLKFDLVLLRLRFFFPELNPFELHHFWQGYTHELAQALIHEGAHSIHLFKINF